MLEQLQALVQNVITTTLKTGGELVSTGILPPRLARTLIDAAAKRLPLDPGGRVEKVRIGEMPGIWVRDRECHGEKILYYLHGGGYHFCSPHTHKRLVHRLCHTAQLTGLLPDYRMAPEHPFPAAVEDGVAGYQWLLDAGVKPKDILFGGDSAGGGLAMGTLLRAKELGLPMPAAAILISPWLDLAVTGESIITRAESDPYIPHGVLTAWSKSYLNGADPRHPQASPIYGDLAGLPPLLIHVGDRELILDDSVRLHDNAQAAGVDSELKVWDDMMHVFHIFRLFVPEAELAFEHIGEFIASRVAAEQAQSPS